MATITGLNTGDSEVFGVGKGQVEIVKHEISIADMVTAGLVTTDEVNAIIIPADTLLEDMQVEIVDASLSLGAGARIDVGDSTADTTYVNNATTLTLGTMLTIATQTKYYAATDTITVKVTGGTIASVGTIRIVAKVSDYSRNQPTTT